MSCRDATEMREKLTEINRSQSVIVSNIKDVCTDARLHESGQTHHQPGLWSNPTLIISSQLQKIPHSPLHRAAEALDSCSTP